MHTVKVAGYAVLRVYVAFIQVSDLHAGGST